MAAASTARSTGPRYAPPDPTLPKPWKGLVDGSTGNLYFWNPETNVTQYQKPSAVLPDSPPLLESVPISSSGDTQQLMGSSSRGQKDCNSNEDNNQQLIAYSSQGQKECNSNEDNNQCKSNCSGEAEGPEGNSTAVELPDATTKRCCSDGSTYNSGPTPQPSGISAELYRHKHEISVLGGDVPMPFMTFESTGFPAPLLREVQRAGFSAPTPIQAQTWPIALQNRDIVAVAKTGSGKTLGYLFPGFIHLKRLQKNNQMGPTMLVLSPTRELATQIQDEAVKFGSAGSISCTCLYGGAPKGPQLRDLDRGTDVVVATPGRLNDILEMKRVSLQQVSYLVLDEADRMLDMGFEPQIRKIVKEIPARRQTLMYTATWPKEVRKIAADLLVKPVQVNIGNIDELVANKSITQHVEMVNSMEKRRRLEQILQSQQPGSKIIIFCATKRMCDQLARNLDQQFGAAAIHGDKSQGDRDFVLSQFRTGKAPILVATDVAARGLDIKDIRVVVNYDFPTGIEDYVHRIGRTGRAGATGVAYTFFSDKDGKYAPDLVKILEGASQKVPLELRKIAAYGGGYGGGVRSSRQWGSGCGGGRSGSYGGGGRNNSTFGSLSSQTSSGGWSGGGNDSGFHDWQRSRFEVDAHGGYGNKEQHVADNGFAENCIRNRSRSPVNRGWGGNS